MNFRNLTYYGKIGMEGDTEYMEYIDPEDHKTRVNLAERMKDAIQKAGGDTYTVEQSFTLYPTAGTSTDYACSRCITDPSKAKVHAFTIECGKDTFQPEPEQRSEIIQEVTAAILAFCLGIIEITNA
jgi:murein tripeptide amidase MpaA